MTVNVNVPFAVGVPEISPLSGSRLRPGSREPAVTAKVGFPVPPVVCRVAAEAPLHHRRSTPSTTAEVTASAAGNDKTAPNREKQCRTVGVVP
ncbi:hypothetical protein ACFWA5_45860 [Streptomyces mirabilis]|uniref:hypothetical protein n=1 Tax=Streptomyces mirabilis TaxID=68239 RepID=UPI0036671E5B